MAVVTVYALFADDSRQAFFVKTSDETFYVLTTICMCSFVLEISIQSIAIKGYFNSFHFWLDVISSLSMVTDIGWIWESITETNDFSASNAQQATSLARAGRGARIGTKAGRIIRVIRLVRLIRIVKLYKSTIKPHLKIQPDDEFTALDIKYQQKREAQSREKTDQPAEENKEEDKIQEVPEESRVGKVLNDRTQRSVIILCLTMLFSGPLLNINTWINEPTSFEMGLKLLMAHEPNSQEFVDTFQAFVQSQSNLSAVPLILAVAEGASWVS